MIKVVSMRAGGVKAAASDIVIRIDRGSVLGNPYVMRNEADRSKVIDQFKMYLMAGLLTKGPMRAEMKRIRALHQAGHSVALACWCAPCACHGDLIKEACDG